MTRVRSREVHDRAPSVHSVGLVIVAVLTGVAVMMVLAGQVAAVATGRGWPSWAGSGVVWDPVVGVVGHAGDPMRGWPGLGADRPGPFVYWLMFTILVAGVVFPVTVAVRRRVGGQARPGFASSAEVAARLGTEALLRQAARLRPELVRTTPRPEPTQLGAYMGRDVSTGLDTWSSVRQSQYVVGPSESGKTSALVIPTALDHDGMLVLPSSRADVMAATWSSRADRGPVSLFDPLRRSPGVPLVQWDPVLGCEDPVVAIRRAEQLMTGVDMSRVSDGDTWRTQGEAVLRNLLHAAALRHKDITAVLRWTYDSTSEEPYGVLKTSSSTPDWWAREQRAAATAPDKQRAGVYMSVQTAMTAFSDPRVLATCQPRSLAKHFDPARFVDTGSGTLFLLSERDSGASVSGLLAALMAEVIEAARAASGKRMNNRLDPALRLLAEEAPNTATLKSMPSLISDGGGRGLPTTIVVQEQWQAVRCWGEEDARSMWGAATVRMILPGITDGEQLREIASYVDEYDAELRSRSVGEAGRSDQISVRTLPGLTPAAVRGIPPWHALVIAGGGLRPVLTELTPYFRRPDRKVTAAAEEAFYSAVKAGRSVL